MKWYREPAKLTCEATNISFIQWCLQLVLQPWETVPEELLDSMGRSLPDIWGQVSCCLLDGQHHDGDNYGDTDTGQNPKCTGPDELVWVLTQRDVCQCVKELLLYLKHFTDIKVTYYTELFQQRLCQLTTFIIYTKRTWLTSQQQWKKEKKEEEKKRQHYLTLLVTTCIHIKNDRFSKREMQKTGSRNITFRARWKVLMDSRARSCCSSAYLTR